jgi:hypothetical protein
MSTPAVRRGAGGHWLPGAGSPNPGGRSSALAEVRALLRPNAKLYVDRLNELVRHPDPDVALPALREALDRLLGKAVVAVESDVRTLDMGALYLEALKLSNAPRDVTPAIDTNATTTLPASEADSDGHHEW